MTNVLEKYQVVQIIITVTLWITQFILIPNSVFTTYGHWLNVESEPRIPTYSDIDFVAGFLTLAGALPIFCILLFTAIKVKSNPLDFIIIAATGIAIYGAMPMIGNPLLSLVPAAAAMFVNFEKVCAFRIIRLKAIKLSGITIFKTSHVAKTKQ